MKFIFLIFFTLLFFSCHNDIDFVEPVIDPGGLLAETEPLTDASKTVMNGIYEVIRGRDLFGRQLVIKWSGKKLSVFSGNEGAYAVLEGGAIDSILYFEGYWRFPFNTSTGLIKLIVSPDSGAGAILNADTTNLIITIEGSYGSGNDIPTEKIILRHLGQLPVQPEDDEFEILAHRGGGRNSDYVGASENSIEIIKLAEGLGATGVELDVRMSNDGVLFIYHDEGINLRLTRKGPLWGLIEGYSWAQIKSLIILANGESIPSLSEALNFILEETSLRTVWLDMKNPGGVVAAAALQKEITDRAVSMNRDLKIYIGLPTEDVINKFRELPSYTEIPSLCELGIDVLRELNSEIWAPRWTDGIQLETVRTIQSENKKAFVWTLDQPEFIKSFIKEGEFNGILSNYPPLIAYHHYIHLFEKE